MIGELRLGALVLEGEIFKIQRAMDRETKITNYSKLRDELDKKKIQHGQYKKALEEFEKMETLKRIKRKMLR
jgi:hypothetical protein